jgi:ATP-dependent RNA helicase CshB
MYIEEKLKQLGFESITPIQSGVFKAMKQNKHIVGLAPTGTGKTHAYLLPILEKLDPNLNEVQALITVPTNDLVMQVERMLKEIDTSFNVKAYVGSSDKKREVEWLSKYQPQIVISTPQRLQEYVTMLNVLKIQTAKFFVLDEADMMFDFDFLSLIDQFLQSLTKAQILLFSASITKSMEPFIKKYFGVYTLIDTTKNHTLNIEYQLIDIKFQNRLEALHQVIDLINPYLCFIFVSKKENQEIVFNSLLEKNLNVTNISSNLGVKKRTKIIEDIINLKYTYVVTSDIAARGMDFKISHVIHYDLPHHLEFFLHRSGRTGRMHDTGIVMTLASTDDQRKIQSLKEKGIPFKSYQITNEGLKKKVIKQRVVSQDEIDAVKKVQKPKRIKPNYKKKYQEEVLKARNIVRRKQNANHR